MFDLCGIVWLFSGENMAMHNNKLFIKLWLLDDLIAACLGNRF